MPEPIPQPKAEPVPLGDFAIDEYKPIKVVVIGAGFSGILAGIRSVPNLRLAPELLR